MNKHVMPAMLAVAILLFALGYGVMLGAKLNALILTRELAIAALEQCTAERDLMLDHLADVKPWRIGSDGDPFILLIRPNSGADQ